MSKYCQIALFTVAICSGILLISCGNANTRPARPVTLRLIDQVWVDSAYWNWRVSQLREFTRETGIQVELLPSPESAVEQLALWRRLMGEKSAGPDIYAVDVIWAGLLADGLADLKPDWSESELNQFLPGIIDNYTVHGRLIAIPLQIGAGLLFYRTDLLRSYGYSRPPATWDELQTMASRIQAGERRKGNKDFWGFVWQGATSEALTCNALEWQASEGGGHIIEKDGTISVNNPRAIRAWRRAAHWVGTISPPGVVTYKEWDSANVWLSGRAAFMRNWPGGYVVSQAKDSLVKDKFGITTLPAGAAGHAGTLGGAAYGVSRFTSHPTEARLFVHFLCGRETALRDCVREAEPPALSEIYEEPAVIKANPYFPLFKKAYLHSIVSRPAIVAGMNYPAVSEAYSAAVHSVLAGKESARPAAANLEQTLTRITGFRAASVSAPAQ